MMRTALRPIRWILRKRIYRKMAQKAELWVEENMKYMWWTLYDANEELVGKYTMEEVSKHIENFKKTGAITPPPWKSGKKRRAPPPPIK